jgi:Protein of unknown function (DUF4242)
MDSDRADAPRPQTFLVERYWPGIDEAVARTVVSNLEQAAQEMTSEGTPVAHVGSILMPADEVVFSLIEAVDERAARQVNERADVPLDRIAAAITLHLQSR